MGVTMRSVNFAGLVLTGLFLSACGPSLPPAQQALADALDVATTNATGFSVASGTSDSFGALANSAQRTIEVNLEAGKTYRIIGRCGDQCNDLDLRLYDPNMASLASDTMMNNQPQIEHAITATGQHRIGVTMFNCAAATCETAVRVLSR
jgi:hypothetical protein